LLRALSSSSPGRATAFVLTAAQAVPKSVTACHAHARAFSKVGCKLRLALEHPLAALAGHRLLLPTAVSTEAECPQVAILSPK